MNPFDNLAPDYDRAFTHTVIGRQMREAVWRRLDARFRPGDRLIEINCGTGEDALYLARCGAHVLATDASEQMVCAARDKVLRAGLSHRVDVRQMTIEELEGVQGCRGEGVRTTNASLTRSPVHPFTRSAFSPLHPFDGLLSNFGGLNCVDDLRTVAEGAAACLRPGGIALLCLMGPLCPWEWGWYLARRQPGKAFRRLRRGGVPWRGLTIHYPSVRAVRTTFASHFRLVRASAIGALMPPPYAEAWAVRHPRLMAGLNRCERRWETWTPLPFLADHYLLEMERLP